jgi:molecular chaperone DnaK (HSP70)
MAGRLAVDFGTSNTRLAVWDQASGTASMLRLPEICEIDVWTDPDGVVHEVPCIPSVIHFDGDRELVGRQVTASGFGGSNLPFRRMKHYISSQLELPRRVNGREVTFPDAGRAFLLRVLDFARAQVDLEDEEVAFTVPVEAFEHYQEWLGGVCEAAGVQRYRLLDEASAAAMGYDVAVADGDTFMACDFGGGTLDVAIVRAERRKDGGRGCRVLGKGGAEIGGARIDDWIFQDVLKASGKAPEDVRHISALCLLEAERVKKELTDKDESTFTVTDTQTGAVLSKRYSRTAFEDLLEEQGLFTAVKSALRAALSRAEHMDFRQDKLRAVLLVGGSSRIPSFRRAVRQEFGQVVRYHRPLDAVAAGGAAFVGGVDLYPHIQHEYALRFYDREKQDHGFQTIVAAGTPYPSEKPVAEYTIPAVRDGQEYLGINIYEVGRKEAFGGADGGPGEIVFDPSGGARFQRSREPEIRSRFWINEHCPTFIRADPPARKGDPRFPVQFTIDGNKRLCITVRDNETGKTLMQNYPVVKLT